MRTTLQTIHQQLRNVLKGNKHNISLFTENKPMLINDSCYCPSLFENDKVKRRRTVRQILELNSSMSSLQGLHDSNRQLPFLTSSSDKLSVADIVGAKPMKFRHKYK